MSALRRALAGVSALEDARQIEEPAAKVMALRRAGRLFGDRLRASPVAALRSFPLATVPYPTRFAFEGAARVPGPFVTLTHRAFLVEVPVGDAKVRVLFNPTDVHAARATSFFAQLDKRFARARGVRQSFPSLTRRLAEQGVHPVDVDAIAFDQLFHQDVRPLFGSAYLRPDGTQQHARFPRALWLTTPEELADARSPHPHQASRYVRGGTDGVPEEKIVCGGDVMIGESAALIRTPGLTRGNRTLFVNTARGVVGISENGVCVDNWSAYESSIPGLRAHARAFTTELVLNQNASYAAAEQYASMVLEHAIVDPVPDAPAFAQMIASSEVERSRLAPLVTPRVVLGALT